MTKSTMLLLIATCRICPFLVYLYLATSTCFAQERDVRLALLIANETGWEADTPLKYAIKGDLMRVQSSLSALGFETPPTLVLKNKSPRALRKAFDWVLQRLQQKPKITTFFVYYSGHADKEFLHMGPKLSRSRPRDASFSHPDTPVPYSELTRFLAKVRVKRRFVLLDACFSGEIIRRFGSELNFQVLQEKGRLTRKGVSPKLDATDLSKHIPQADPQANSLHILASSSHFSYESSLRSGSVFTYHFWKGLQGKADLDHDGKISVAELFRYARPLVKKETDQTPSEWAYHAGEDTYAFAPAYQSILRLPSSIQGEIVVSLGNFVWRWKKKSSAPFRLATTAGKGVIFHRKAQHCREQTIELSPKQMLYLSDKAWRDVPCEERQLQRKGSLQFPATEPPPEELVESWSLEVQSGLWGSSGLFKYPEGDHLGSLWVGVRSRWFALSLSGALGAVSFLDQSGKKQSYLQSWLKVRGEGGYRQQWTRLDLFVGLYLGVGVLLHDLNWSPLASFALEAGGTVQIGIWLNQRWAVFLAGDGGVHPALVQEEGKLTARIFGTYSVRVGFRFRFGEERLFL